MAIAITELRVGNWIRSIHTGSFQLSLFALGEIADDETYLDHLMPIPLTPEILVACGFKKYPTQPDHLDLEYRHDYWISFNHNLECRLCYDLEQYVEAIHPHIKYLHQLQNLYFCLTGQELNYKP